MLSSLWDAKYEEYLAVTTLIRRFIRDERGATAVEYGLLAALVSVGVGSVVSLLGETVQMIYQYVLSGVLTAYGS